MESCATLQAESRRALRGWRWVTTLGSGAYFTSSTRLGLRTSAPSVRSTNVPPRGRALLSHPLVLRRSTGVLHLPAVTGTVWLRLGAAGRDGRLVVNSRAALPVRPDLVLPRDAPAAVRCEGVAAVRVLGAVETP